MSMRRGVFIISLMGLMVLLGACAAQQGRWLVPTEHPTDVREFGRIRPLCTDCHEARGEHLAFVEYNHSSYFADNHRLSAARDARVCGMCHQTSFCNACHATGIELKPSLKNQSDTFARTPHRGDFLTRHRIEGRVDPGSCYRCHGNPKAARTCAPCHG